MSTPATPAPSVAPLAAAAPSATSAGPASASRPFTAVWPVPVGALLCLVPAVPPVGALLAGIALGLAGANTRPAPTRKVAQLLLKISVVGLGAGMNLALVLRAGMHGLAITIASITATLLAGRWLGRRLGVSPDATLLVSVGTAICGGSAIAAVSGAIKPKSHDVAVALATVFLLNGVALIIFPPIGHAFNLTQVQFGWWAALAIHDTSSVVGAGLAYGAVALGIATAVKLARALWIAPLTLWLAHRHRLAHGQDTTAKSSFPWFILGFVAMAALFSFLPGSAGVGHSVAWISQRALVATLFLIGAGFTREALKATGARPLVLGVTLWICIGCVSLALVKFGLIF